MTKFNPQDLSTDHLYERIGKCYEMIDHYTQLGYQSMIDDVRNVLNMLEEERQRRIFDDMKKAEERQRERKRREDEKTKRRKKIPADKPEGGIISGYVQEDTINFGEIESIDKLIERLDKNK